MHGGIHTDYKPPSVYPAPFLWDFHLDMTSVIGLPLDAQISIPFSVPTSNFLQQLILHIYDSGGSHKPILLRRQHLWTQASSQRSIQVFSLRRESLIFWVLRYTTAVTIIWRII